MSYTKRTDEQLQAMSIGELTAYSQEVSTVIGNQYSSIVADQVVQAQYDYMILTSQSTVNGLDYQITLNNSAIVAADIRYKKLQSENVEYDSTITYHETQIFEKNKIINDSSAMISSLTRESKEIAYKVSTSDSEFISSAVGYSTLYITYVTMDILYKNSLKELSTTSSLYEVSRRTTEMAENNLKTSTTFAVAKSAELSSLYKQGDQLQSTLSQYIINETNAKSGLISTNAGIIAVSSLYATALTTQQYYQLVSTQTIAINVFTQGQSTFDGAKLLSLANPTNTVLNSAMTMAQQRLSTLADNKNQITSQVNALKRVLSNVMDDSYETAMVASQATIDLQNQNISTFQGYADVAKKELITYSTIFENSSRNIASSMTAVNIFDNLYKSSIAGSNALMERVIYDTSSISGKQAEIESLNMTISVLDRQYTNFTSSFNGWIEQSTIAKRVSDDSKRQISILSTFYESTSIAVQGLAGDLRNTTSTINGITTTINTLSTIIDSESINALAFRTDVHFNFTLQEQATYKYRETYVRLKRVDAQSYYDSCVLKQVQDTSTQNGTIRAQVGDAAFTPISITLNTPTIGLAYVNLTTITSFLNTFSNLYTNYDIQATNLQGVSTSIGNQRGAYSTMMYYKTMFSLSPTNEVKTSFYRAQNTFINNQNTTSQLLGNVSLTQGQINDAKRTFLTTYNAVFLSSDIIANESTISSFLVAGFKSAMTTSRTTIDTQIQRGQTI